MTFFSRSLIAVAAVASSVAAAQAQAGVVNGRFTAGLTGWQTLGDASVQNASNAVGLPLDTSRALVLTTASLYDDDVAGQDAAFNLSGIGAVDVNSAGGVAEFAHADPTSLELDPVAHSISAIEGSAARRTLTVQAGDTLSFNWNLFSRDRDMPDTAWLILDLHTGPAQVITLASAAAATQPLPGGADALQQSGWQSFRHTFTSGGAATLTWAIADMNDWGQTSMLALSTVQVTPSVPEPASLLLMLAAGGAVGVQRRASRQK
ncbi:MAG: PEP-CTERM sorting domain-containing protein [Acidobacteriota bacterium]